MLYVDNVKVSAKELEDRFKVTLPKAEVLTFELTPRKRKFSYDNNVEVHPPSIKIRSYFSASDNTGQSCEIRFATGSPVRKKDRNGNVDMEFPENFITWSGKTMIFDPIRDRERVLYLYLNEACGNSPFCAKKDKATYAIKDFNAEAEQENLKDDYLLDALTIVSQLSDEDLRFRAKGLDIHSVDKMTTEQVKRELNTRAKTNPYEFIRLMKGKEIKVTGIIRNAIDKQIVIVKKVDLNDSWVWNHGIQKGTFMCVVKPQHRGKPSVSLIEFLQTSGNEDWYGNIMTANAETNTSSNISKLADMTPDDDIGGVAENISDKDHYSIGIAKGVLQLDGNTVYTKNKGNGERKDIMTFSENAKTEFNNFIVKPENGKMMREINLKISKA